MFAESVIDDGEWKRSTNKKRADALFAFIRGQDDLQYQLELLMRLLAYVRRRVQPDSSCILLIYDNIDKIQYEAQMEILYAVMSYQHMADVRVLVTLRRTSFEKLASQRVYSFGAINHAGAEPLTVVKLRLTHYLEHFEDEAQTAVLEPETAMALKRRMKYVLSILEHNSSSYVVEALRAFPGRSVRLCMFMMVRAFVNQTMPFDAETVSMSDLARAIIIGDSADGRMTFNDDVVANILHDGISHVPSLLCLRILGILKEYQDAGSRRTLGNLIALLREIDEWSVSDILYALNYLMNVKRPLVWADGVTAFDIANSKKWLPAREILFLSSAGEAYLRTLAMQLVYFQECCLPMDWPEGVPFSMDMRSIDERMRLVRRCVFEIQRMDSEQVKRYTARKRRAGEQSLPLAFISNRILYGLGRAAHAIFAKHRENSGKVAEEWQNWYGQIISSIDLERELTGQANKRLEDLAETYRVALADAVLESST